MRNCIDIMKELGVTNSFREGGEYTCVWEREYGDRILTEAYLANPELHLILVCNHCNFGDKEEPEYSDVDQLIIRAELMAKPPSPNEYAKLFVESQNEMFFHVWHIHEGKIKWHKFYQADAFDDCERAYRAKDKIEGVADKLVELVEGELDLFAVEDAYGNI